MIQKYKSQLFLILTIGLSLWIHFTLWWGLQHFHESEKHLNTSTPIEIITREKKSKSVVTQTELQQLQEALKDLTKKADYFSQKVQRVQEQTKARRTGETKNLIPQFSPLSQRKKEESPIKSKSYQKEIKVNPQTPPTSLQGNMGPSSVREHLPFVKEGFFTALNTDQIPYYAFYSRINGQIGTRWVQNIRRYYQMLDTYKVYQLSKKDRVTQLEVVLDASGNLLDIFVYKTSGSPDLDNAAIKAFESTTPYLNPPSGLVSDEDGLIHLHYSFHIRWRPPNLAGGQ